MQNKNIIPASIIVAGMIVAGALVLQIGDGARGYQIMSKTDMVVLPVVWGDLGQRLVEEGVIDGARFQAIYESRGEFTPELEKMLTHSDSGEIVITRENAGYLLNLLWALGLGNKNPILEEGEMVNPKYGGAENFASTGGWTLAVGHPMTHYSMHEFVNLSSLEQEMVDKVSRNVYRPCCSNSAHFPDCNHGMAMLGLLELLASQGASESEMYQTAITVNSYWFPGYTDTVPSAPQISGCSV